MDIQVISKSVGIRMRCDNQTVTTSVMAYGIRIQNGVDWQKIRELIADGVEWGKIVGDIHSQADLIALIQEMIVPSDDKDVINVLTACPEDVPYPEDAQEGDKVIDLEDMTLMEYDGVSWTDINPDESVIYLTADTSHIYVYNANSGFKDVTGEKVDNTIYISSLSDLDEITESGVYNVVQTLPGLPKNAYTLVVYQTRRTLHGRPPRIIVYNHQVLSNKDGWMQRSKSGSLLWSDWNENTYMTVEEHMPHIQEAKDWAVVGWVL